MVESMQQLNAQTGEFSSDNQTQEIGQLEVFSIAYKRGIVLQNSWVSYGKCEKGRYSKVSKCAAKVYLVIQRTSVI